MEIKINKSTTIGQKPHPRDSELGFGKYTTDHMFLMDYDPENGWHNARIEPYGDLQLDPAAMVLHYNQEVFEGLKAYQLQNGGIGLFRPVKNIERMNASTGRMVMPKLDPDLFLRAIKELVLLDRNWIPQSEGTSLYIRPTMIATEAALGVRPSDRYLFYIINWPGGCLLPRGIQSHTDLCFRSIRACRHGRSGRGQDFRQLRADTVYPAAGRSQRLHPGPVARCKRAPLCGGGRYKQYLLLHQR